MKTMLGRVSKYVLYRESEKASGEKKMVYFFRGSVEYVF